jgi:ribosomal protein L40E
MKKIIFSKIGLYAALAHTGLLLLCLLNVKYSGNPSAGKLYAIPMIFDLPILTLIHLLGKYIPSIPDVNRLIPNPLFMSITGGIQWYLIGGFASFFSARSLRIKTERFQAAETKAIYTEKNGKKSKLCGACGAQNNPTFDKCWKCGSRFVD